MLKDKLIEAVAEETEELKDAEALLQVLLHALSSFPEDAAVKKLEAQAQDLVKRRRDEAQTAKLLEAVKRYEISGELFLNEWNSTESMVGDLIVAALKGAVETMISRAVSTCRDILTERASQEEVELGKTSMRLCSEVIEACRSGNLGLGGVQAV